MHDVIHAKRERRKREKESAPQAVFMKKEEKKGLAFLSPLRGRMSSSFLQQKTKKRKEKENPCFASSSLLSSPQKEWRKVFSSFLSETRKEKDGERDHHPFLIFPSGRHGYPSFLYWRKSLCIISLFFSSLVNEKKKEENASIHTRKSFSFFVQTEEEKRKEKESSDEPSFPSPNRGGRDDGFLL